MNKIEVYEDIDGYFRWRLIARDGRIVADSGESYHRKSDATRAAFRLREIASKTRIEVEE